MYVVCSTDDDEDQALYYVQLIDEIQLEGSSPSCCQWHVDQMPRASLRDEQLAS